MSLPENISTTKCRVDLSGERLKKLLLQIPEKGFRYLSKKSYILNDKDQKDMKCFVIRLDKGRPFHTIRNNVLKLLNCTKEDDFLKINMIEKRFLPKNKQSNFSADDDNLDSDLMEELKKACKDNKKRLPKFEDIDHNNLQKNKNCEALTGNAKLPMQIREMADLDNFIEDIRKLDIKSFCGNILTKKTSKSSSNLLPLNNIPGMSLLLGKRPLQSETFSPNRSLKRANIAVGDTTGVYNDTKLENQPVEEGNSGNEKDERIDVNPQIMNDFEDLSNFREVESVNTKVTDLNSIKIETLSEKENKGFKFFQKEPNCVKLQNNGEEKERQTEKHQKELKEEKQEILRSLKDDHNKEKEKQQKVKEIAEQPQIELEEERQQEVAKHKKELMTEKEQELAQHKQELVTEKDLEVAQHKRDLEKEKEQELVKHKNELEKEKEEELTKHKNALEKEKEQELAKHKNELEEELAKHKNELEKEKEEELAKHKNELEKEKEEELAKHKNELEKEKEQELAKHKDELKKEKEQELTKHKNDLENEKEQELAKHKNELEKDKEQILKELKEEHSKRLEKEKQDILKNLEKRFEKEKEQRLKKHKADLEKDKEQELAKHKEGLEKDKEQILKDLKEEHLKRLGKDKQQTLNDPKQKMEIKFAPKIKDKESNKAPTTKKNKKKPKKGGAEKVSNSRVKNNNPAHSFISKKGCSVQTDDVTAPRAQTLDKMVPLILKTIFKSTNPPQSQ